MLGVLFWRLKTFSVARTLPTFPKILLWLSVFPVVIPSIKYVKREQNSFSPEEIQGPVELMVIAWQEQPIFCIAD